MENIAIRFSEFEGLDTILNMKGKVKWVWVDCFTKNPLTKEDKRKNRELSSERVVNENVIGMIKRFKIVSDRYRNRRKRFGLRFNLIAAIYNMELTV